MPGDETIQGLDRCFPCARSIEDITSMHHKPARREFLEWLSRLSLTMAGAGLLGSCPASPAFAHKEATRVTNQRRKTRGVIVLGMDGLDPKICRSMMKAGDLPAFAKLANRGSFSAWATANPPQSPVAWSSMGTSTNPGQHGIYDFLARNKDNYLLELAILKFNPRNILGTGSSMFLPVRKGRGFWEEVAENGANATVLRWPITFPPQESQARLLSGLGVPDIMGGLGRYSFFSDSEQLLGTGGKGNVKLVTFNGNIAATEVMGPKFSSFGRKVTATLPLKIRINSDQGSVSLTLAGDSDTVKVGSFSKWFRPKFSQGFISSARGICKFYVGGINPLRLHVSPIEVDPQEPVYPISNPDGYASELALKSGLFHTLGMPEDTNAVGENHMDEKGFLTQCDEIISSHEKQFFGELDAFDSGLLANVFFTSDRIQHIFWVTRDPDHPGYSEKYAKEFGHVIPDLYKRMDGILANTLLKAKKTNSEIIVCSDHGFCSFRYGLHVNSWLAQEGFMALKSPPSPADNDGGPLFQNVDWSRTKAYFFGFNQIFLNLAGREGKGSVSSDDALRVMDNIKHALLALRDNRGVPVVSNVFAGRDIYHGMLADDAPDLVIGFHPGFRASWQSALGGAPGGPILVPNLKKWSGDHLVDPSAVPGSLFTSFGVEADKPSVLDLGPTVLSLLGIEIPKHWEGNALI